MRARTAGTLERFPVTTVLDPLLSPLALLWLALTQHPLMGGDVPNCRHFRTLSARINTEICLLNMWFQSLSVLSLDGWN